MFLISIFTTNIFERRYRLFNCTVKINILLQFRAVYCIDQIKIESVYIPMFLQTYTCINAIYIWELEMYTIV